MRTRGRQSPYERVELAGFLAEFREALEDEIEEIKKSGQSSIILSHGRQIESHNAELWYIFEVEYAPSIPADTPCKLFVGNDPFDVTVVSFDENSIIVSTKTPLPPSLGIARLENGAAILMELLIKCIEDNADKENPAGKRMFLHEGDVYQYNRIFSYNDIKFDNANTESQNSAITAALSNDITYIWGPPGTGKTTVIGQIIDQLYNHNRTVLLVSHTNTAVDGAIEKAYKSYDKSHPGEDLLYPILRIGVPTRDLPEKVLLKGHVDVLEKELNQQKETLEKEQDELLRRINEILPLLAKCEWITKSNLARIAECLRKNAGYTETEEAIRREIESITGSIEHEKASHPEYTMSLILPKTIETKRADYKTVCDRIQVIKTAINDLPSQIQHAQDEIRKHAIYAELRAREEKYMPSSFLRNELETINKKIEALTDEISSLTADQAAAYKTVSDYERKNSVAKLLSGKSAVTQAKATLQNTAVRLPQAKEELARQHKLEEEYNRQLQDLLLLQEQTKAVLPSETKEHWQHELERLQSALKSVTDALPRLNAQKDALYDEISMLEQQLRQAKKAYDLLNEYETRLHHAHELLTKVQADHENESIRCSELIKQECSYCAAFFHTPSSKGDSLLFDELSALFTTVKEQVVSINAEELKQEKEKADKHLSAISCQLDEINEKIRGLERQAIMNARVIGATLAKSYLSDALRERTFDTVILDEASMASIPALWCAAYLADSSIVIVGDVLQLPPIVMANTPMAQKWLGTDIFAHSGMQEQAKAHTPPENFVMLNDQFRMESDIADIANLYYGLYGKLISHDTTEHREKERDGFYQWYQKKRTKSNIHLIDTESLHAWVTGVPQGKRHSRLNCFSAVVDVDLAFRLLEEKLKPLDPATAEPAEDASVLIVAPFKPHITLVKKLIDLEYRNRGFHGNMNLIRAGTIHSFQGSEADIVIFDLVVDEPHYKANLFMTDQEINDDLRKMFNVAVPHA